MRSWQIDFARWVNCLGPVVDGIDTISFEETDRRLAITAAAAAVGRALIVAFARHRAAATPAGAAFLSGFCEAIGGVDTIRKELAMRKALLADPDASMLDDGTPAGPALERELARFSRLAAEVATGTYSLAAAALSDEQDRLAGEAELREP